MNKAQPSGRAFRVSGPLFEKGIIQGAANQLTFFIMWKRKNKPSDWRKRNTRYANTKHTDCKRLGEASEAEFLARAARLFFRLAKPWGESDPYDALVAIGRGFWRVQVKCASSYLRGQYVVKAGGDSHNYTKDDIDFLAAHIVPEDIWYIVPIEAFEGKAMLHFCPHKTGKAKYERYREAWCLLKVPLKARGWRDIPAVCRCRGQLPVRCAVCPRGIGTPSCVTDTPVRRS